MYPEKTAFVDLFCGSCSVIEKVPAKFLRIANDKNKYLISMFKNLGKVEYPLHIDKNLYDKARNCYHGKFSGMTDDIIGWIGYMASYNGRFFDGGYSGHKVETKNGKFRDYITENINNINQQIPLLNGVTFLNEDYYNVEIPDNSIVYCDPPYKGTKQYDISKNFDYDRFYDFCRSINKKGIPIFISEYNMPDDFECVWQKQLSTCINQTLTKKPIEKLFTFRKAIYE